MAADDAPHATLSVAGETRQVPVVPGVTTAAALVEAVADRYDADSVKLLHRGKRLAPGDALLPGMKVLCLGTTRGDREKVAAIRSDPTLRGFEAEAASCAVTKRRGAFSLCAACSGRAPEHLSEILANFESGPTEGLVTAQTWT